MLNKDEVVLITNIIKHGSVESQAKIALAYCRARIAEIQLRIQESALNGINRIFVIGQYDTLVAAYFQHEGYTVKAKTLGGYSISW